MNDPNVQDRLVLEDAHDVPVPPMYVELLSPVRLGGLKLRNRIIRAGCYEGMAREGSVTDELVEHHRAVAAGGVGMTTVAYCAVDDDGRGFADMLLMRDELVPQLRRLTDAVHDAGAAASLQLVHCGYFADPRAIGSRPLGASEQFCAYRMSRCRAMSDEDIERKTERFAAAATRAREAGFDAVEIHAGHGYLLSQFLSPFTNHRTDRHGGTLENRLNFPAGVVRAVREAVGSDFPVLVKMNVSDGMPKGIGAEEAVEIARAFEKAGASALVPSCGFVSATSLYMLRGRVPYQEIAATQTSLVSRIALRLFGRLLVQEYTFEPLFLLEAVRALRRSVRTPVAYVGGVLSAYDIGQLFAEGFAFVQVGRATIRDPEFVNRMASGEIAASDCDHCNRCVAAMEEGGVRCISSELGLMDLR
jgi:2,4-dienoyl-CoA reductase-like NADH-dependent reductase (Old Yellow Enzyme family)